MTLLTACGLLGATVAVLSYALLANGKVHPQRGYAWLNLIASALIGASLIEQFNAAAAMIQVFFGGLSAYALLTPRKELR